MQNIFFLFSEIFSSDQYLLLEIISILSAAEEGSERKNLDIPLFLSRSFCFVTVVEVRTWGGLLKLLCWKTWFLAGI